MSVRVKTLEIRWHHSAEKNYSEPIYACDFQPLPVNQLKKLVAPRIQQGREKDKDKEVLGPGYGQCYRLVTGGGDNNIRVWMVYPNVTPPGQTTPQQPARVEYLATLSKHTAAVNVVRFSPNGEFIASAGDDGMLAIWSPTDKPVHNFGDSAEELQYEKEHWRPRVVVRATTREVYDLAWSPNGEYIVTGSTDNTARVHNAVDGTVVREITEHSHYVQGVAWDPLNEFLATQSSDRSVHVHAISTKRGVFETHAVGKNSRMKVRQTRTPSRNPPPAPRMVRRQSNASDTESIMTSASERPSELEREPSGHAVSMPNQGQGQSQHYRASSTASNPAPSHLTAPLTPATSIASTPIHTSAPMFPPSSSRRSSISSAAAPSPPQSAMSRYGRSPSPMPPLPAIRTPLPTSSNTAAWATKLYGDENFTNFFRRLTFSPDGALMLTPAGQFEDHSHALEVAVSGRGGTPAPSSRASSRAPDDPPVRPKRERPLTNTDAAVQSSVYIYARAGLSSGQNPIAHLPGYKRASVAVKFCPLLFELRQGVVAPGEMKRVSLEIGKEQVVHVDLGSSSPSPSVATVSTAQPPSPAPSNVSMSGPGSVPATPNSGPKTLPPPASSASESSAVPPTKPTTSSVFALPYRMLFAVATQDTVMIYDTQQSGPICMFSNLHYSSFTDMAWAPDGQSLMLASSDGYCSLVVFDDVLPLYHTQQHNLQLHSIAASHSHPHPTARTPVRPSASPAISTTPLPGPGPRSSSAGVLKRSADSSSSSALPTPAPGPSTVPEEVPLAEPSTTTAPEPVKKKRRIAPTIISTLDK